MNRIQFFISSGQCLGHFLTFDNGARDAQGVCDKMMSFLQEQGVEDDCCNDIVHSLAELAEKKGMFVFEL